MDRLEVFSDASFGPVHERCRWASGCVVEFAGCVIAWDSQAQPFISQSTAEAEVISDNSACQTAESISCLYLRNWVILRRSTCTEIRRLE